MVVENRVISPSASSFNHHSVEDSMNGCHKHVLITTDSAYKHTNTVMMKVEFIVVAVKVGESGNSTYNYNYQKLIVEFDSQGRIQMEDIGKSIYDEPKTE